MTTEPANSNEVDAPTLQAWLAGGSAHLVDVREADEHARERIAGATPMPLSRFDPARLPLTGGRRIVFHCKSGRRSAEALARARAAGIRDAMSLTGGIEAWKSAGLQVATNARLPIPIMRQVQITAGSIVLLGCVLDWFASHWFVLLSGFIGAGLVFAGVSGTCGLAAVLGLMPWNRALRSGASCAPRG